MFLSKYMCVWGNGLKLENSWSMNVIYGRMGNFSCRS